MNGSGGDDSLFSSEIVLTIGALVLFVVLLQVGVVGTVGKWLGELMMGGAPVP